MRSLLIATLGTTLLAAGASAQEPTTPASIPDAVRSAQPNQYTVPACDLGQGHFKISSGRTYVKTALESPDNRARIMGQAKQVLEDAITIDGQADKAEAWFWLGRVYLYEGDIAGADSALARAKTLAPQCATEIDSFRRPTWAALTTPGLALMNEGNTAEARKYLEQAAAFYQGEPQAFSALGIMAANDGNTADATKWFEKAVAASTDSSQVESRKQALFNLGLMYQREGRHEDAARVLSEYMTLMPDDNDARRALMLSLREAGMADSAMAIERRMAEELTSVGADASVSELMTAGVTYFNDKKYAEAAGMFEKVLAKEPYNRDAAFNLANAKLGASDADGLIMAGKTLVAIEPMNEMSQKLYATGFQLKGEQDTLLTLLTNIEAMPVSVQVTGFNPGASAATWTAVATGRSPMTIEGNAITPKPVSLAVEFLDASGAVVATEAVTVPVVPAGGTHEFSLKPSGSGIIAWRYRVQ